MKIELGTLRVWQALSMLCCSRDGTPASEERCRSILHEIGMKKSEMDQLYPEEGMEELEALMNNPKKLTREARKASEWMIRRN